jgi:malonyl-CoA/methylmalonyl-CoA synthetase
MNAALFARLVDRFPEDRAARFLETDDGERVSFADLLDRAGRIATLLNAAGVRPGDRVVVQVEKSPAAICLYLACLQTGAIYVPLNTGYTLAELEYFIADAEPRVVVCDPGTERPLGPVTARARAALYTLGADGGGRLTAEAAALPSERAVAPRAGDDVAAILYTSGTTGRSKGAMLTHDNLWSNALTLHRHWGFVPGDVLIHALPLYHTHGLFVAINVMLINGGQVILMPRFDAGRVIEHMARATVLMGVPTFYTRLLADPRLTREACGDHAALRVGLRAAARPDPSRLRGAHRPPHPRALRHDRDRHERLEPARRRAASRHGRLGATRGSTLRVGPGGQARLPPARSACSRCAARTSSRATGATPTRPRPTAPDGWFVTGDLATIGADGYVTIVGRDKDLIISGGLNVYPVEVEAALDALPGVTESAVIGAPHPDLGEAVVAVLTVSADPGDVVADLRARLAGFKLPRRVVIVDALPRNAMGKVQKAALRERFRDSFKP